MIYHSDMKEIYIKTIEQGGYIASAFTVRSGKIENFRCFANHDGLKTKGGVIPFIPGKECYQSELYALAGALHFAADKKVKVYTHHKVVASWLNARDIPDCYGELARQVLELPVEITAEQVDYGRSKVMNGMIIKMFEFVSKLKNN